MVLHAKSRPWDHAEGNRGSPSWLNGGTASAASAVGTGTPAALSAATPRALGSPAAGTDGVAALAAHLDTTAGCEPEPQSLEGAALSLSAQELGANGEAADRATDNAAEPSLVATVSDDDL